MADYWRKRTMSQSGWLSSICWSTKKPRTNSRDKPFAAGLQSWGCRRRNKPPIPVIVLALRPLDVAGFWGTNDATSRIVAAMGVAYVRAADCRYPHVPARLLHDRAPAVIL